MPPASRPAILRKPTASSRSARRWASSSVSAATTTSLSGSTTQAARVPTAARTIVTLMEPGTWAASYSTVSRPSISVAPASSARPHGGREQRVHGLRVREQRPAVQGHDALEVRRLGGQVAGERPHEGRLVLARQQPVEAALEPDRRARLLAHAGAAAERAADMPGPHLREVAESEEALHRGVQPARALLLVDREIGPGDIADEERVARDDEPGLRATALVRDQVGGVLGPVARRRERGDRDLPDPHRVPVGQRLVREVDARRGGDVDGRARRLRQPALAGDVVCVVVRLQHVRDREAVLLGEPEVVLDVPLRVDHDRLAPVRDDVGSAAEVLVQHLAEEHCRADSTPLVRVGR